jgi:uncharacterized protein (DUF849 family)
MLPKEQHIFCVCGISPAQLSSAMNSALLGMHVRDGLEDKLYDGPGLWRPTFS